MSVDEAMTIWKRAMIIARRQNPDWQEWQIQEAVFVALESEKAERGWTEQECVDAARWAAGKVKDEQSSVD